MRKMTIVPAIALSLMTLGLVAEAVPASAHPSVMVAGEDDDDGTPDTVAGGGGGGGAGAPSGGAGTGAGGTATEDASTEAAPFVLAGVAGVGLLAASAALRRRRTVDA
jgi:hypothetical protein